MAASHLGKIFISHSSADKPFARRLDKRLRLAGYDTWLDEHELVPGDSLSSKIAEGVREARVVLVVVSKESVKSKWLKYELNLATGRMVNGDCRVIPIVIDHVSLPAEVLGLLYAGFRKAFRYGFRSVTSALQHENTRAAALAEFWVFARDLIHTAFGGHGYVSLDSEYADESYEFLEVAVPSGEGTEQSTRIVFDTVPSHGQPPEPLAERWWKEFRSAMVKLPEALYLVATERPILFDVKRPDSMMTEVSYREFSAKRQGVYRYVVFVDFSSLSRDSWVTMIVAAKQLLEKFACNLSASICRQTGLNPAKKMVVWVSTGRRSVRVAID